MTSKKPPYFSDKELLAELKKLGYNDVTPDIFNMMKNDLSVLVERDNISSRKLKNLSSVRYTSTLKQLASAADEIPNANENNSLFHSNDSIKKDLYSKYKSRFNSYGLNIETRSPVDQQSCKIYQGTNIDYKKGLIKNITDGKDDKITEDPLHSIQAVKIFPKSQEKDNIASNVSQVVNRSSENNFVRNKPHISESTSPTNKGSLKKDNPVKPDGKISNKKDINKPYCLNSIIESNYSASVSKTYHNKDNSIQNDYEQNFVKSDKNKPSEIKVNSVNPSNCENGLLSKKDDLKAISKFHQIALMTRRTKATVEYQSLNSTSKSQSRSSLEHQASTKNANDDAKQQDDSESEKPKGDNSVISSTKSQLKNYARCQKKYDQNSEKSGGSVKSSIKNRKTVVNDFLTSSGSTVTTKRNDQQVNKHKELSLKGSKSAENSNSVLSISNRQDSPKLPSIEHPRASKIHGENISASSLYSSDDIENHDTKSSRFSLDSSLEAEGHENKFGSSPSCDSSSPEMDDSLPKYRFSTSNRLQPESPSQNRFSSVSTYDSTLEPEDPLEKYRRRFKLNAFSSQEDVLGDSSIKIKRKVLRHRNGESIVTEELLNVPSIFTSSYPSTELGLESSKSFSSDDLSFRTSVVPEVLQSSYSTPRSIHVRIANQRKKKADPVAMYNYYKKFWNNFKPPGEKSHDKLRWAVRDRMLDYKM